MSGTSYDVVVIGAGPAGLAAAMFTARRGLQTVIVSEDLGGQLALTEWVENYPGVDRAGGRELCERMRDQAVRDGAIVRFGEAVHIERSAGAPGDGVPRWVVALAGGEAIVARAIILAFGLTPNDLGVPGEDHFHGKGVYHSAVDDAPLQDGKIVAVVGGGNSAVTAALELAPRATRVHLIHRREAFRAEVALRTRLQQLPNVEVHVPYVVTAIEGTDHVSAIMLASTHATEAPVRLDVDSVFVQIGYHAKTTWLAGVITLNEQREIVIDRDCRTSAPGIFAAGDVTDIAYKQAVISAGEGVKAALQVWKYLQTAAGKPAVMFDWDTRGGK